MDTLSCSRVCRHKPLGGAKRKKIQLLLHFARDHADLGGWNCIELTLPQMSLPMSVLVEFSTSHLELESSILFRDPKETILPFRPASLSLLRKSRRHLDHSNSRQKPRKREQNVPLTSFQNNIEINRSYNFMGVSFSGFKKHRLNLCVLPSC